MQKIILQTNSSGHLSPGSDSLNIGRFADGEISITIDEDLAGKEVFVVGSTHSPSENLMELLFLIDAAVQRKAAKITVIIPYFGYARSDRVVKPNEVPCGSTVVRLLEKTGGKKINIVTFDFHSQHLKKSFDVPVLELKALPLLAAKFTNGGGMTVVAPDKGAYENALKFSKHINSKNVFFLSKKRFTDLKVEIDSPLKKITKDAVIYDDMVSSGNTIIEAVKVLKTMGAENIFLAVTHMVYPGGGWKKLNAHPMIKKIFLTDTISPPKALPSKFEIVSIQQTIKDLIFSSDKSPVKN
jgi:ribose-phosphate pyrophosphokinase